MRLIVTGGGTGGGIYPALAVVDELCASPRWATSVADVLWVGRPGGLEERVMGRRGIRFQGLRSGPLRGMGVLRGLQSIAQIVQGAARGRRLIDEFDADVVLATGGYVSAPVLVASWHKCPSLIYLPDMKPGLAVRYLSPLATRVAVSFDSVLGHFPKGKAFVSGYPVRRDLVTVDRQTARAQLGFPVGWPVLLVSGGSTGAHAVNSAVRAILPDVLRSATVLHICGQQDHAELVRWRGELPMELRERYRLYAYMYEEMPQALVAADLVVGRAGAAALAEYPAVGLPAILVPYPHSGQHQLPNAAYMASRGAAVVVPEADLAQRLLPTISELLSDADRRMEMARASRALAVPGAAATIAAELTALAKI